MYRENFKRSLLFILFANCTFVNILVAQTGNDSTKNVKEIFEREYKAYTEAAKLDNEEFPFRSASYGPRSYRCLHRIAKLGTPALPYLMEEATKTEDMSLSLPINIITRRAFARPEWPEGIPMDSRGEIKLYITWWNNGRKLTPQQFSQRYSQWKDLKKQGKEKEAKEKLEEIRALGIAALPMIKDKVSLGDQELVPLVSILTGGKVDPNVSIQQCVSWWEQNKENWLIPFPNKRPVAKAGQDRTATSGDTVQLDGLASTDADKDALSYWWKQIAGPAVNLSNAQAAQPSFTAPQVEKETVLIFELVVNDGSPKKSVHPSCESGESDPNTVNITVKPKG